MRRKLGKIFFNRPTLKVARDLLGKFIVRAHNGKRIVGMIAETEAYIGPDDRAAHSFRDPARAPQKWHKRFHSLLLPHANHKLAPRDLFDLFSRSGAKVTPRNVAEYLEGGTIYIYLVYGMYWNANISTGGFGKPECVLLRGVLPVEEKSGLYKLLPDGYSKANGPGKLCNYLKLNKSFYAENVATSKRVWLEDRGIRIPKPHIQKGPRIGIEYAGPKWIKRPWRFLISTEVLLRSFGQSGVSSKGRGGRR